MEKMLSHVGVNAYEGQKVQNNRYWKEKNCLESGRKDAKVPCHKLPGRSESYFVISCNPAFRSVSLYRKI